MDPEDFSFDEDEEYLIAASQIAKVMKALDEGGVSQNVAMEGALTQLLTQLFMGNSSQAEALGILASCLSQASENTEKFEDLIIGRIACGNCTSIV